VRFFFKTETGTTILRRRLVQMRKSLSSRYIRASLMRPSDGRECARPRFPAAELSLCLRCACRGRGHVQLTRSIAATLQGCAAAVRAGGNAICGCSKASSRRLHPPQVRTSLTCNVAGFSMHRSHFALGPRLELIVHVEKAVHHQLHDFAEIFPR